MSKSKGSPKVFDVLRPGKAQASPTSRQLIVGHKSAVKDSAISTTDHSTAGAPKKKPLATDPDETRELLDAAKKVNVAPISAAPVPASTEVSLEDVLAASTPVQKDIAQTSDNSPSPDSRENLADTAMHSTVTNPSTDSTPGDTSATTPPEPSSQTKQDTVLDTTAAPAIDMSQAVVSSHLGRQSTSRWTVVFIILLLAVVIGAAAFVLLIKN